jgi:hypothetical protein
MMTEIGSGVAQRRSIAIVDDVDAASWDRLAAQMRAVGDAGGIVAYDIGAHEPIEDDHEQT